MKNEVAEAMNIEIEPEMAKGRDVLNTNAKISNAEGKAYASWEKVNPKIIFSLCCSGGGIS
ncbi:MAG TPA: hypothetical protein VJH92_03985 [Candidatus Nanoarchaeia archaeon]|nr:hypothetical protein [Candidatus Nanoarchaeia archaeon]